MGVWSFAQGVIGPPAANPPEVRVAGLIATSGAARMRRIADLGSLAPASRRVVGRWNSRMAGGGDAVPGRQSCCKKNVTRASPAGDLSQRLDLNGLTDACRPVRSRKKRTSPDFVLHVRDTGGIIKLDTNGVDLGWEKHPDACPVAGFRPTGQLRQVHCSFESRLS
jgi:hypothetical protein